MANAQDRRTFLFMLGLGVLGGRTAGLGAQTGLRLGFHLAADRAVGQPAVLRALQSIGYREIELGPTALSGPDLLPLRRALDQFSLAAPSRHVPMSQVFSNARTLLNDCRILGCRQVVCEEVPAAERASMNGYRRVAGLLDSAGKITQFAGVQLAVRVVPEDLTARAGVVPLDFLLARTNATLVKFQMDLDAWTAAGRETFADFSRYRGRFTSVRLANAAAADLPKVLAAARSAGIQQFFVADTRPDPSFDLAKQTFDQVSALKL